MRIKTNCSIEAGPGSSSAWYLTKAFRDLGHELVLEYEADLVINIDGHLHVPKLPGVPYFFWDCDSFLHEPNETTYAFDQIFIGGSPEDLKRYPEGTIFLPHAFDEEIHKPHDVEKPFDIVMIGNMNKDLYSERNNLVELLKTRFSVWHQEVAFGDPYAEAMSKGKLIFNKTLGEFNIPIRFFEGMAIGALVHNDTGNLDALATAHTHYIPYQNPKDLLVQIEYYLNHEDERFELIKQARKHALENHTYKHRAEEILKYV